MSNKVWYMLENTELKKSLGVLIFFLAFMLYLVTLAPSISIRDSGDMITSAYTLGISHPGISTLYATWKTLDIYTVWGVLHTV